MEDEALIRIIYSPNLTGEGIRRLFSALLQRSLGEERDLQIDIEVCNG